jgi:Protein kinase domain
MPASVQLGQHEAHCHPPCSMRALASLASEWSCIAAGAHELRCHYGTRAHADLFLLHAPKRTNPTSCWRLPCFRTLHACSVATVFRAICTSSGAKVIIKVYYKSKMHPKHHHKLERELSAMRMLSGPFVAQLYASFEDSGCIYIIMEHCEGGDLFKTMLMHGGLLDEAWVCIEVWVGQLTAGRQSHFWCYHTCQMCPSNQTTLHALAPHAMSPFLPPGHRATVAHPGKDAWAGATAP